MAHSLHKLCENTGQGKSVFSHILCSDWYLQYYISRHHTNPNYMFRYNIVTGFSISLKRSQFHWYHLAVLYLEICVKTLNFKFCQLFSHTKNPSYMLVRVLNTSRLRVALRKMQKFYLIFWCRNFVEKHRFPPKLYGNRPFQQNFNTMKLGEILVF